MSDDQGEQMVVITMKKRDAERISFTLSDALCWLSGYRAGVKAGGEFIEDSSKIISLEDLRVMNLNLKEVL